MRELKVDAKNCLEHCEGSIVDVNKLSHSINFEAIQTIVQEYENYKRSDSLNLTFPSSMEGNYIIITSHLNLS